MGAVFASTRFSLVRISIRDLVADGKSLVRNSGVGGGGQNSILKLQKISENGFPQLGSKRLEKSPRPSYETKNRRESKNGSIQKSRGVPSDGLRRYGLSILKT